MELYHQLSWVSSVQTSDCGAIPYYLSVHHLAVHVCLSLSVSYVLSLRRALTTLLPEYILRQTNECRRIYGGGDGEWLGHDLQQRDLGMSLCVTRAATRLWLYYMEGAWCREKNKSY